MPSSSHAAGEAICGALADFRQAPFNVQMGGVGQDEVMVVAVERLSPVVADPSLADLTGRLRRIEQRVVAAVRRTLDGRPAGGRFRGIVLTGEEMHALLDPPGELAVAPGATSADLNGDGGRDEADIAPPGEEHGTDLPLRNTAVGFDLDDTDLDLLLVALAPDLDARFERFYAWLQDDVTRVRPTVGLALDVAGLNALDREARQRLGPAGRLVSGGLVEVHDSERPFLTRSLRVPDAVADYLLGSGEPDPAIAHLLVDLPPLASPIAADVANAVRAGATFAYLHAQQGGGLAAAVAVAHQLGVECVAFDGRRFRVADDRGAAVRAMVRYARLQRAPLAFGPVEALDGNPDALAELADSSWVVLLSGRRPWDASRARMVPISVHVPVQAPDAVATALVSAIDDPDLPLGDVRRAVAAAPIEPGWVASAARLARHHAALADRRVQIADVHAGLRAHARGELGGLARRIEPARTWDDLVLPRPLIERLRRLAARVANRSLVLDDWGLAMGRKGRGVAALFSGASGVGKTMSAEVLAGDLGVELHTVDLAATVDKYIGETEKNLDRMFTAAEMSSAVLFFDEADALFGKRSEVRDARDRYANLEVAYLLQRLEAHDGVVILATNLAGNIDDAFARRLDDVITFPSPDADARRALWDRCLGRVLERSGDLPLDEVARRFDLTGGSIRNAATTAAYIAADAGPPVCLADVVTAVALEYRKLGRLCSPEEFGPWYDHAVEAGR